MSCTTRASIGLRQAQRHPSTGSFLVPCHADPNPRGKPAGRHVTCGAPVVRLPLAARVHRGGLVHVHLRLGEVAGNLLIETFIFVREDAALEGPRQPCCGSVCPSRPRPRGGRRAWATPGRARAPVPGWLLCGPHMPSRPAWSPRRARLPPALTLRPPELRATRLLPPRDSDSRPRLRARLASKGPQEGHTDRAQLGWSCQLAGHSSTRRQSWCPWSVLRGLAYVPPVSPLRAPASPTIPWAP